MQIQERAVKRRILVTGASGLVGGAFIKAMPHDVELILLGRRAPQDCARHIHSIEHDLSASRLPSLPNEVDTIVHLAQERDYRTFPERAAPVFAINTAATLQLLDWGRATGVRRFVLASTGGLYAPSTAPATEKSPIKISDGPLAFYFGTKQGAEILAQSFQGLMNVAILRFFFVYGAKQASTMLFPRLIASVGEDRPIHLAGKDGLIFNPIHANDAGAAVVAATFLNDNLLVNVAGPEIVTLRSLGEQIGKLVGRRAKFEGAAEAVSPSMVADIGLMRRHLRAPSIGVAEGLAEMINS
jgi:nucleoside-diphosphate-sugar epimerase